MAEATPAQAPGTEAAPAADGAPGQPSAAGKCVVSELNLWQVPVIDLFYVM